MNACHTVDEARVRVREAHSAGKTIGFVPTMGALHRGHASLIERARRECGFTAVSIFVNPTQFGPSEDFTRYPRTLDSDLSICEQAGVDMVFAPSPAEMYPEDFSSWVDVQRLTDKLEGASRPGHFRGVTTVCAKLFNIITPDRAYFGRKDYQQLKVIQKMVRDLNMPLEIVPTETVREEDGLAMSSRNRYLNPQERRAALVLRRALLAAQRLVDSGERSTRKVQEEAENLIKAEPLAKIDYVELVDAEILDPIGKLDRPAVMLLAVRIGATRLIDNTLLNAL